MSIQKYDAEELWQMRSDDFNEWRAKNDLPILYEYFINTLPDFAEWTTKFQIDSWVFSHTIPTGKLLFGDNARTIARTLVSRYKPYYYYLPLECEPAEHLRRCQLEEKPVPEFKTVVPYLAWGRARFGKNNFVPHGLGTSDNIQFGRWEAINIPAESRAFLINDFALLKLGGVQIKSGFSARNLDFTDLDHLIIDGRHHYGSPNYLHYCSCNNITILNAHLAFYTFRFCNLDSFRCESCNFQDFQFLDCTSDVMAFSNSRLRHITFNQSDVRFDFAHCELSDFKYVPVAPTHSFSTVADVYRQIRIAFQDCGKRHEAAAAYYQERVFERKALAQPYLERRWMNLVPRYPHVEGANEILARWRSKDDPLGALILQTKRLLLFYKLLFLTPRYLVNAVKFKARYAGSLSESVLWGYGERPGRILIIAIVLLVFYSAVYYSLLTLGNGVHSSVIDCIYLSLVTFTTLGYGDITPKTTVMKMVCGSEALIGAFVVGLFVAGFSNKSRY